MPGPTADPRVVAIGPDDTHALRTAVLRDGDQTRSVEFDGDRLDSTVHLGVRLGDELVATSTWLWRRHPDHPAVEGVQLRGMATAQRLQGSGIGGLLLEHGVAAAADRGAALVWARARDAALEFYLRHGFAVFGRGYVDLTTDLPHHDVIRHL
ncbi:MAG: GNAT family N-acetyltransferase [Ilumatobacteraceae bacterium]|jgi:predicted GNAT family N-acyltransferase|nr:GNAT family N-acetyltransferase [Ilumatobacteraceae bacterium]